ncbi:hypothetical protein N7508_007838 [Penicillium antarcticum]|uniref:uncharacterized protein n=1 Tax=Penicillium antarcticum TaxID=416450 RepID=UPI00238C9FBF|nr:uncharacterized protein N7508_007838 [Penicillium antarcticum]KAJ5297589.1 hypothetical protein N7508_007838 [Penicillium antarcticum]
MFKSIVPALLVATILPTTLAKTCSAVGAMADNSVVGLGPQGVSNSVHLYDPDGNEIGSTDSNACTDLLYIEGDGLTDKFAWAASCNLTKFKYADHLLIHLT